MTQENPDFYKRKVFEHYPLIDRIIRKRFPDASTADEAFLFVIERIEKDDWRRIREYKGHSSFTTYLTKVVSNLILDFSDHKFGKFRPPVWVKKMGALWEEVHKRLCRERMSKKDVEYSMTIGAAECRDPEAVREAIEVILEKIPDCGRYGKGKLVIADSETIENRDVQGDSTENANSGDFGTAKSNIFILETLFPFFDNETPLPQANPEITEPLKNSIQIFREALSFSAEDRLFLKMVYQDGFKIKAAGRMLNIKEKQVREKHRRLLGQISKALQDSGLDVEIKNIMEDQ